MSEPRIKVYPTPQSVLPEDVRPGDLVWCMRQDARGYALCVASTGLTGVMWGLRLLMNGILFVKTYRRGDYQKAIDESPVVIRL